MTRFPFFFAPVFAPATVSFFIVTTVVAGLHAAPPEPATDPAQRTPPGVEPNVAPAPVTPEAAPVVEPAAQPQPVSPAATAAAEPEPPVVAPETSSAPVAAKAAPEVGSVSTNSPAAVAPPPSKTFPPIHVGARLRAEFDVQNGANRKQLNDLSARATGELHFSGKVHELVGYNLNLNAQGLVGTDTNAVAGRFLIMDAAINLDFIAPLRLKVGQVLVPVDRSNLSGPFFVIPWTLPELAGGIAGGHTGPLGRSVGGTLWGEVGEGVFKYYAGVYNLSRPEDRPLYNARINAALLGKEPTYAHHSSYYGEQTIVTLGLAGQFQKDGNAKGHDYSLINADALAEFIVGRSVITAEAAGYVFPHLRYQNPNDGRNTAYESSVLLLGAFLMPDWGFGRIHPMVRYQQGTGPVQGRDWILDTSIGLVVDGFNLRGTVGYQHQDIGNVPANAIRIGVQTIQF